MKIEFDTVEELADLLQFLGLTISVDGDRKRPKTGAERTRKWRSDKSQCDEKSHICDDIVTKCDENVTIVTKCDEKTSHEEKKAEKEEALPLFSPSSLSSSPCTPNNNPITPYNPPLREEKGERKEVFAAADANGEKIAKKAGKPKSKPEDTEFWNFAKENSEMARQFWTETGIYPVKREFGRWINDLRDLAEAEITIPEMQKAVAYMKMKNVPIGAPGSILKTARWLKTNSPNTKEESWTERAARIEEELNNADVFGFGYLPNGEVIDI